MKSVLTIAGSDSSGGAGIQADIKTLTENGVYASSVITALTAQNTVGVQGVFDIPHEFVKKQLDSVFTDIFPDAVKIGMVSNSENIKVIYEGLKEYKPRYIVVDPVMISTSGRNLLCEDAINDLCEKLFRVATVITPNIPEAEYIYGNKIKNDEDRISAARYIYEKYNVAVLIKGGHSNTSADDLLYYVENDVEKHLWFKEERIDNPNNHGTGCTLSSAIAANLAKGYSLEDSVTFAKNYLTGALRTFLNLGKGNGPLMHSFDNNSKFMR